MVVFAFVDHLAMDQHQRPWYISFSFSHLLLHCFRKSESVITMIIRMTMVMMIMMMMIMVITTSPWISINVPDDSVLVMISFASMFQEKMN